ncbi:protein artemis-like [Lineus longissimus]|uniref:protein artemis-like n=1 Tax=Lineus longissimus TaxID=88925 RepID=UPI002B4C838D
MSTFMGLMKEYCSLSIDRFDGENLRSTAFFLSHCHQDHMNGLTSSMFSYHLGSSIKYRLYCSDITKVLLETDTRYVHLQKHLTVLPINQPTTIQVPDKVTGKDELITVTLIPAGHCLGSVMFLFEGNEGTVLYTGDFRLPQGGPARISPLMSGASPKLLKSLYIDTTFCILKARHIPSREESADAIVTLVEGWIHQSDRHVVKLITKAAYSYEHLYEVLYKKFGKKVHVTDQRYRQYQLIPGLSDCTTTDPTAQIHACGWKHEKVSKGPLACGYRPPNGEELKLMVIQPSTMWFTQHVGMADIVKELASKYRVCYCFHPSYSEIQEFVGFFRPEQVFPNVRPLGNSLKEVQLTLDTFRTSGCEEASAGGDNQLTPVKKSLGKLKTLKRKKIQCSPGESEGLLFDDDEVIPKKRRKPSENHKTETEAKMENAQDGNENSDAESYHTNSYKGSDNEEGDILESGDEAGPPDASAPPSGSLLSYISDDEGLENDELSKDLSQNSVKSAGFSQSADMFDDDLEADPCDLSENKNAAKTDMLVDISAADVDDDLNCVGKSNGAAMDELKNIFDLGDSNPGGLFDEVEEVNMSAELADSGDSIKDDMKADSIELTAGLLDQTGEAVTNVVGIAKDAEENAKVGEISDAEDCDTESLRKPPSERKSASPQNTLEASGDHGEVIDTDATTICSQPFSQSVISDGDVEEIDRSASSTTSAMNLNQRTARKSTNGSCQIITHILQSGFQQVINPRNVRSGPEIIEIVDLTADDSDESDSEMVPEELSDSSIMEYGECSDDYEGDESDGDPCVELDSEDDYSYFRQAHAEILDSEDDENCVEFDEDDDTGEVIIVGDTDDSSAVENIDLMGEARQIARVRPMQSRQHASVVQGGESLSSSDVDIIHEQHERDSDSDFMLEEDTPHLVTIDDGVGHFEDSVVNLDDSVVDLDSSALDIDNGVKNVESSIAVVDTGKAEHDCKVTDNERDQDASVVVPDGILGAGSQDLFSSDPGDHLLHSDTEAADNAKILVADEEQENDADGHESCTHAVEAQLHDSDNDLGKEDEDKLLDSDNEEHSGEVIADDALLNHGVPEQPEETKTDEELLGPTKIPAESPDGDPSEGLDVDHLLFSDPEDSKTNDADLDPKLLD